MVDAGVSMNVTYECEIIFTLAIHDDIWFFIDRSELFSKWSHVSLKYMLEYVYHCNDPLVLKNTTAFYTSSVFRKQIPFIVYALVSSIRGKNLYKNTNKRTERSLFCN